MAYVVAAADLSQRLPSFSPSLASSLWCEVSLGFRPNLIPRAVARLRPSSVLALISSRSNSASPPSTVRMSRPCESCVGPSIGRSKSRALAADRVEDVQTRVLRANRSNRITSNTSPDCNRLPWLTASDPSELRAPFQRTPSQLLQRLSSDSKAKTVHRLGAPIALHPPPPPKSQTSRRRTPPAHIL